VKTGGFLIEPAGKLDSNPKSTFKLDNSDYASSYDHMYVPVDTADREYVTQSCNTLDTTKFIYGKSNSTANMKKSKQELFDHLPVWAGSDGLSRTAL